MRSNIKILIGVAAVVIGLLEPGATIYARRRKFADRTATVCRMGKSTLME